MSDPQSATSARQRLYDGISKTLNIGTFEQFNSAMDDTARRKKFFEGVSQHFNIGDYQTFESKIAGQPQQAEQPAIPERPAQPSRPLVFGGREYASQALAPQQQAAGREEVGRLFSKDAPGVRVAAEAFKNLSEGFQLTPQGIAIKTATSSDPVLTALKTAQGAAELAMTPFTVPFDVATEFITQSQGAGARALGADEGAIRQVQEATRGAIDLPFSLPPMAYTGARRLVDTGLEKLGVNDPKMTPEQTMSADFLGGLLAFLPAGAAAHRVINRAKAKLQAGQPLNVGEINVINQVRQQTESAPMDERIADTRTNEPIAPKVSTTAKKIRTKVEKKKSEGKPLTVGEEQLMKSIEEREQPKPDLSTDMPPLDTKTGEPAKATTEATAEDFELNPTKTQDFTHVAIKLGDAVYKAKYGEDGVYNHADLVEKNGLMDRANDVTPGFIDKNGNFVESGVAREAVRDVPDYPAMAEEAGVKFEGMQNGGENPYPLFTDPETKSTFTLKEGESVTDALKRKREQFGQTEAQSPSPVVEKQAWEMTRGEYMQGEIERMKSLIAEAESQTADEYRVAHNGADKGAMLSTWRAKLRSLESDKPDVQVLTAVNPKPFQPKKRNLTTDATGEHRAKVQQAIAEGKIKSHPDYPDLAPSQGGAGAMAQMMVNTVQKSVEEIRGRVSNVRLGGIENGRDVLLFDFDGKPHRAELTGELANAVIGMNELADKKVATRLILDKVAKPDLAPKAEAGVSAGEGKVDPADKSVFFNDDYYKKANDVVDGRTVRSEIPNEGSIEATFEDYEILPGVREVLLSDFEAPPEVNTRTKKLAEEIRESGEINPLIVAVDSKGPYILEGGHRYDALKILGAKSFPAKVVIDVASRDKALKGKAPDNNAPAISRMTKEGKSPEQISEALGVKPEEVKLQVHPNLVEYTTREVFKQKGEKNADAVFKRVAKKHNGTENVFLGGKVSITPEQLKESYYADKAETFKKQYEGSPEKAEAGIVPFTKYFGLNEAEFRRRVGMEQPEPTTPVAEPLTTAKLEEAAEAAPRAGNTLKEQKATLQGELERARDVISRATIGKPYDEYRKEYLDKGYITEKELQKKLVEDGAYAGGYFGNDTIGAKQTAIDALRKAGFDVTNEGQLTIDIPGDGSFSQNMFSLEAVIERVRKEFPSSPAKPAEVPRSLLREKPFYSPIERDTRKMLSIGSKENAKQRYDDAVENLEQAKKSGNKKLISVMEEQLAEEKAIYEEAKTFDFKGAREKLQALEEDRRDTEEASKRGTVEFAGHVMGTARYELTYKNHKEPVASSTDTGRLLEIYRLEKRFGTLSDKKIDVPMMERAAEIFDEGLTVDGKIEKLSGEIAEQEQAGRRFFKQDGETVLSKYRSGSRRDMPEYRAWRDNLQDAENTLQFLKEHKAELNRFVKQLQPPQPAEPSKPVTTKEGLSQAFQESFGLSQEKADAVSLLADTRAEVWAKENGKTKEEWYSSRIAGVKKSGKVSDDVLFQENAPAFYSRLRNLVESKMPNAGMPEQVRNIVKTAPQEEVKWTGLDEWLSQQKGKVTKQQVLDFLDQNKVEVREVVKGVNAPENPLAEMTQIENEFSQRGFHIAPEDYGEPGDIRIFTDVVDYVPDAELRSHPGLWELAERYSDLHRISHRGDLKPDETSYADYQLPGGKNYRELLLTMPAEKPTFEDWAKNKYGDISDLTGSQTAIARQMWERDFAGTANRYSDKNFKSPHWSEPNVLAHVRFNDRIDADGKQVLFLEEVQSDWHQKGRQEGYKSDSILKHSEEDYANASDEAYSIVRRNDYLGFDNAERAIKTVINEGVDWIQDIPASDIAKLKNLYDIAVERASLSNAVPDAPFKNEGWKKLALRRMVRWAAENGYDRIAWTTGEQQAARYDLSKQVKAVEYMRNGDTFDIIATDHNGTRSNAGSFPKEKLPDVVGKDLAEKIIAENKGFGTFSGLDLKVGGEGMKGFYDKELVNIANDLGKKFGARVGETEIGDGRKVEWSFNRNVGWEGRSYGDRPEYTINNVDGKYLTTIWTTVEQKTFDTLEQAKKYVEDFHAEAQKRTNRSFSAHSLPITPEMRRSVLTEGQPLFQSAKGAVEFLRDGRAIIHALENPDVSTAIHELGHVFRRDVTDGDLTVLERWAGVQGGKWEKRHEEYFARGFEKYVREGKAPTPQLKTIFEKFKTWLTEIYKKVTGSAIDVKIPQEVREVFDNLFREERPQKTEGVQGSSSTGRIPVSMEPQAEPVKASDIIAKVSKSLELPIRVGNTRWGKRSGIFKVREEVARLREANDLGTMAHEIAHFIDKKSYQGKFRQWQKELADLDYDQKKRRTTEGFAEFVRHYLTTDEAQTLAPRFYQHFVDEFLPKHPRFNEILSEAKGQITQWREQGAEARIISQIDFDGKKSTLNMQEKMGVWALRFKTAFTDQLAPLNYAVRMITGGKKIEPRQDSYQVGLAVQKTAGAKARAWVMEGIRDFGLQSTGKSLKEIVSPVAGDMKKALAYAYAKRAIELHDRGINPGISLADAEYVVKKNQNPAFETFSRDVTEWMGHVMDYLVEAGGLSAEAAAKIRQSNTVYIPLKRAFEEMSTPGAGKGYANLPTPIKRIKGSGRDIINPLESMIQQTEQIIAVADKARVARTLIELSEQHPGSGRWVEKVAPPAEAARAELESLRKQIEEAGGDLSNADMDAVLTLFSQGKQYYGKDNIVSIFRNGKREFFEVDPEIYRALLGLDKLTLPWFVDALFGAPARAVRLGATGIRAGFALITNPIRDVQTYALQSDYNTNPARAWRAIYREMRGGGESGKLFRASGGEIAQPLGLDRKTLQNTVNEILADDAKSKALNAVKHPVEALRELMSFTEAGPRLAEFEAVMEKYRPQIEDALRSGDNVKAKELRENAAVEAANAAADVTVNFRRAGWLAQILNQFIPFFNPAIQGLTKAGRTMMLHPVRTGIRATAMLTAPTLALWMLNKDEEWYKNLPDWQRYGFWNFKIGDTIYRLPKPFEWGYLFAGIPEATANSIYQKDPEVFKGLGWEMGGAATPDVVPALVKPMAEAYFNWDMFRSRPVVSRSQEDLLPQEQFTPYTSTVAKELGDILNVSPSKIDHLLSGYTGGLATDILRGLPTEIKEKSDMPIIGRLFVRASDVGFNGKNVQKFYDMYKELTSIHRTVRRNLNLPEKFTLTLEQVESVAPELGLSEDDIRLWVAKPIIEKAKDQLGKMNDYVRALQEKQDIDPDLRQRSILATQEAAARLAGDVLRGLKKQSD